MINLKEINEKIKGSVIKIRIETIEQLSFYDSNFTRHINKEKLITYTNNQPTTENIYISSGEECSYITSYYYNQKGQIERVSYSSGGGEYRLDTFNFDNNEQLTEHSISRTDGLGNSLKSYVYNNNEVLEYSKRPNGSMDSVRIYQLDEMNRITKESCIDYDGIKLIREYSYEKKNDIEYITQIEANGRQLLFENGLIIEEIHENVTYESYEYSFDDFGNWITKTVKKHGFVITKIETREITYN